VRLSFRQRDWPRSSARRRLKAPSKRSEPRLAITLEKSTGFAGRAALRVTVTAANRAILDYTCDIRDMCAQDTGLATEPFISDDNSEAERSTSSGAGAPETPPLSPPDDTSAALTLFFDEVSRVITNALKQSGPAAVPEPTSLSLFALGIAGLATLQNLPPGVEAGEASRQVRGRSVERPGDDEGLKSFGAAIAGEPARAAGRPQR